MGTFSDPAVWFVLFVVSLASAVAGAWWHARIAGKKQESPNPKLQLNVAVAAVVVAVAVVLFQLPSLSIDINGIFTYAFDVVNAFMPLIAIVAGLGLGFNLITKISGLFNRAL